MKDWKKVPTGWILDEDTRLLRELRWVGIHNAETIASLMLFMVIAHHTNHTRSREKPEVGTAILSYTDLSELAGISRAKISGGLSILSDMGLIGINRGGKTNLYTVEDYEKRYPWGKLPAKRMYDNYFTRVLAFQHFHLRDKTELNALKIYYLIVALRNDQSNYAKATYDTIADYTGVHKNQIKSALSLLVTTELIRVDSTPSEVNEFATANMYRLTHLNTRHHMGTTGRSQVIQQ